MDMTHHIATSGPQRGVGLAGVLSALLSFAGVVATTALVAFFVIQ